jgi:hypothetical protein
MLGVAVTLLVRTLVVSGLPACDLTDDSDDDSGSPDNTDNSDNSDDPGIAIGANGPGTGNPLCEGLLGCLGPADCPSGSYCKCIDCGFYCGTCVTPASSCGNPNLDALTLCDSTKRCPNGGSCNVDAGNGVMACSDFTACTYGAGASSGAVSGEGGSGTTSGISDADSGDAEVGHATGTAEAGAANGSEDAGDGEARGDGGTPGDASDAEAANDGALGS